VKTSWLAKPQTDISWLRSQSLNMVNDQGV
jgi:hypothetical protein